MVLCHAMARDYSGPSQRHAVVEAPCGPINGVSRPRARQHPSSERNWPLMPLRHWCVPPPQSFAQDAAKKMAAAGAAALLTMSPLSGAAIASEFDIMAEPRPTTTFYFDDAGVLSKSTRTEVNKKLNNLEVRLARSAQCSAAPRRHPAPAAPAAACSVQRPADALRPSAPARARASRSVGPTCCCPAAARRSRPATGWRS